MSVLRKDQGAKGPDQGHQRTSEWRTVGLVSVVLLLLLSCGALSAVGCSDAASEARALEKAKDWQGALAVYEQILAEDPDDVPALSGAAVALQVLGRYDEALAYQERVIAADPSDAQTRVELGFNYLNHQGRPDDAVRVMAEAAALEPSAQYLTFLSQAQRGAGELDDAEGSLRRAIATDPRYGFAYGQLADLLEKLGKAEEAARVLEEARTLGLETGEPK